MVSAYDKKAMSYNLTTPAAEVGGISVVSAFVGILLLFSGWCQAEEKPNVLVIISDDQGFGDFGFNGNTLVRTPVLDRLAGESAVFRNFVVGAACSPSRAALFTGRDHLLTGVWGVPPRANLRDDEVRMPAFFKVSGYRTTHVGKLDCALTRRRPPSDFGWDEWMGVGAYEHKDAKIYSSRGAFQGEGWTVDVWTDKVLAFIHENRDRPWFASVAFIIPHLPWICDAKYSAPFIEQGCSKDLAECYGSIAHMDECIGRILETLRETDQDKRTIVVFLSDNGATSPEVRGVEFVPGEDWRKRNVAGLRGHKALIWENGVRVPLLVRWPGHISPGARKQFACVEDVLPTLLDLSDVAPGAVWHLPFTGTSLRTVLEDPNTRIDHPGAFRITIYGDGAPGDAGPRKYEDHHVSLRGPRFVFHALRGGGSSLYDLDADPGETSDVSGKFPEVAAKMAQECRKRWDEIIVSGRAFAPLPGAAT
jgi:arylsulfatase A-like enzyme